jgi:hypothetical protein
MRSRPLPVPTIASLADRDSMSSHIDFTGPLSKRDCTFVSLDYDLAAIRSRCATNALTKPN